MENVLGRQLWSIYEDLKRENFEYLLMDTYYDTNFGIVDIGNNRYVTNNIPFLYVHQRRYSESFLIDI